MRKAAGLILCFAVAWMIVFTAHAGAQDVGKFGTLGVHSAWSSPNGTVSHYLLDNDATDSAGPMDGAETNITYGADWRGNANSAAVLDGTAYITVDDAPRYDFTSRLAVAARIKKDDLVGTEAIVSKWNSSGSRREWNLQIVTQKLQVVFGNPNTGAFEGTWSSDDNVIASTGIWYHVAATYDGALAAAERVKLYVDGTAVASSLASGVIPATLYNGTANVLIGARTAASIQDFFSGSIDDVVIATSLRADEITDLSNGVTTSRSMHSTGVMDVGSVFTQSDGPLHRWLLNDNAADTDVIDSTSPNTLTFQVNTENNSVAGPDGTANSALSFDGTNDWAKKSIADFRSSDSVGSISAWIKVRLGGSGSRAIFTTNDEATSTRFWTFRVASNNILEASTRNADALTETMFSTSVEDGLWHHVALTTNDAGDAYFCYLDGVLEGKSGDDTGRWLADVANRDNIMIGAWEKDAGPGIKFDGSISDVRYYNRVLTADEINDLSNGVEIPTVDIMAWDNMNAGAIWTPNPVSRDSVIFAYDMSEDREVGGEQVDVSGSGNNATVTDFTGDYYVTDRFNIADGATIADGTNDFLDSQVPPSVDTGTIWLWFKTTTTAVDYLFGAMDASSGRCYMRMNADGTISATVGDDSVITTAMAYNNDAWTFAALTWDGTDKTFIVNQVRIGRTTQTGDPTNTDDIAIAALNTNGSVGDFAAATIDHIEFSTLALTDTELGNIFLATKPY